MASPLSGSPADSSSSGLFCVLAQAAANRSHDARCPGLQAGGTLLTRLSHALVEIPPHRNDDAERPDRHEDVVAGESAVVQHRGGERQHHRREQRAPVAQPRPEEQRHEHQRRPRNRVQQSRSVVAVPKQEEQPGRGLHLKRAVHHRVVNVPLAGVQIPRVEGVQALVVMERADSQVPEPYRRAHDAYDDIERHVPRTLDGGSFEAVQECVQSFTFCI